MAIITVLDRQIDVNIREEVEEFEWEGAKWSDEKLIARSPFRDDRTPSFYITFEGEFAGVFGDSAAESDWYKSGTLPKLLAYLRNETYEEACDYLLSKYDYDYTSEEISLITPDPLDQNPMFKVVDLGVYADRPLDTDYLPSRGIHPKVIELQGVFDNGNSIGIPWRDTNGNVRAIKYRSKKSKEFWYYGEGTPVGKLVYGLDTVIERGISRVAICEAEIDAMTWQSAGIYAIAIGGARINERQVDQIIASGVDEIIIAGDNDAQGRKFNEKIQKFFTGIVDLWETDYSSYGTIKDVNELGVDKLRKIPIKKIKSLEVKL